MGYLSLAIAVFGISYQYNRRFLDWIRFQSLGTRDYIVEKLSVMFIDITPEKILLGQIALSVGSGVCVFLLIAPQFYPATFLGLITMAIGWKAPKPIVNMMYRRRVKTFVLQMVDGLSLMSNGLKSGLSVVQSMGLVMDEMPNPIRQEFSLILNQNKLGVPLEEALTNLSKRIASDDVEMFVTTVNILKETGGNLAESFDTIVTTIRERIKIESKIDAMTAQGFYQGVFVMMVPPALGFVFYQSDPEFMKPMFTTPLGWAVLSGVVLLQTVGFFVIMKIVKVEV